MTLDENNETTKARPLKGRCALVTGASRGIGRSIALELARQGASVAVNFLNSQDDAVAVAKEIDAMGSQVMLVKANVSIRDDVQAMVAEVQDKFGGLDTIVSNAAAGGFRDLNDLTPVNLEATLRNNSAPVVWLAQAAAESLAAGSLAAKPHHGKVVAVSSHGSQWAVPHYGAIGASKAALESFVRHLALEFGDRGVNFNCVLPGIIPTDAIASMPGAESLVNAATERMMVGNRRLCEQDVASVVAFLCDGASDLIQGQTIVVDGGVSIRI